MTTVKVFGRDLPVIPAEDLERRAAALADGFDYERISRAMHAVGWTWVGESPTPAGLRAAVLRLVTKALTVTPSTSEWAVRCGGFRVSRSPDGSIHAAFILSNVGEMIPEEDATGYVVVPEAGKRG